MLHKVDEIQYLDESNGGLTGWLGKKCDTDELDRKRLRGTCPE